MAFPSVTEIYNSMYAGTLKKHGREVVDQTFQRRPLYYWLKKKGRKGVQSGTAILTPVQLKEGTTATGFGRGHSFAESDPDLITMAKYTMKNVGDSLTRFWADEMENAGKEQVINLVTFNTKAKVKDLEKKVQAYMWQSTPGANEPNGLPYFVSTAPTTGSIGGIDRATETLWRNQYATASGSAYTTLLDDMLSLQIECNKYGKNDAIICGKTFFTLYNAVAREQKYITDKAMGDAEFQTLGWSGLPLMLDTDCSAGYGYFLDSDTLQWLTDSRADLTWTDWKEKPNSLDRVAQLVLRCQLICNKLNANGVLSGVAA